MGVFCQFFDGGRNAPVRPNNWRLRVLYAFGRWLACRHGDVRIHPSALIHPEARICARDGRIEIGEDSLVAPGTCLQGNVRIGRNCSVQMNGILVGYGRADDSSGLITIGDNVRIAAHCMMIAANHNFERTEIPIARQGLSFAPITVEDDVWIGGYVKITAGVRVGHGSVIGMGSVVTRDIPPMSVAVGVPARVIRRRDDG
ncbi:MAG: acetyltransferase [Lentisphaerae bacterium]|nr:MAG: acetyltransferase [Lentisphaerota bacterium]